MSLRRPPRSPCIVELLSCCTAAENMSRWLMVHSTDLRGFRSPSVLMIFPVPVFSHCPGAPDLRTRPLMFSALLTLSSFPLSVLIRGTHMRRSLGAMRLLAELLHIEWCRFTDRARLLRAATWILIIDVLFLLFLYYVQCEDWKPAQFQIAERRLVRYRRAHRMHRVVPAIEYPTKS